MTVQSKRSRWYGKDAHRTKGNYRRTRYRDVDTDDPRLQNNWGAGIDPDFVEFTHANTELRYYFWPNIDGSVMLTSDPDGILTPQSVVFIGSDGLSTEDNADFYYDGMNLNLPRGLLVGSGTAADPPVAFIGEEDKGMYSYATGQLGFSVSGTHVVELNSTYMGGDIYFHGNGIKNDNDTDMQMTFDVGNNKIKFCDKNAASICDLNVSTSDFAGDVRAVGRFKLEAGTGNLGTFNHGNTDARIWVFPDATGTVPLTSITGGLFASGAIPFASGSGLLTQDSSNFIFDNVNKRLVVGTTTPGGPLHVHGLDARLSNTDNYPTLHLMRDDDTEQDGDVVAFQSWWGKNDAGTPEWVEYARLAAVAEDVSDGTEDGAFYLGTIHGGTFSYFYLYFGKDAYHQWRINNTEEMRLTSTGLGIRVTASTPIHAKQDEAAGAIPVGTLEQIDVDEPFLKYIGTAAAADLTRSIVDAGDVAVATVQGYVKVEVQDDGNRITDQDYFIPVYTLA
jgi:hypothetical protein